MEEKKVPRVAGTKVSQIANIFQNKAPLREDIITPLRTKPKLSDNTPSDKKDTETPSVTVMRTESHVARFNNARALFEKLGEENRSNRDKIIPLQSTKSASSILDLRSRSSSANSENRDTKSHQGSRSPSPKRKDNLNNFSNSVPVLNSGAPVVKSNGHNNVNGSLIHHEKMTKTEEERTKPTIMKKPEKPERKFNSRELIEKQRNWTSHFSKTRTSSRYHSDPNKSEVKFAVTNGSRDVGDNKHSAVAARSSSFNNKMQSPPTSPPPPPERTEASRRQNVVRRDRPASVIPTTNINSSRRDIISHRRSLDKDIVISSPTCKEKVTSPLSSPTKTGSSHKIEQPPGNKKDFVPKMLFSKEGGVEKESRVTEHTSHELTTKSKSPSQDSLRPSSATSSSSPRSPISMSRSPLDDRERSKDSLSGTSGSLSSISPPSSPSRVKTENEKQEQESNEKSHLGGKSLYEWFLFCFYFKCLNEQVKLIMIGNFYEHIKNKKSH